MYNITDSDFPGGSVIKNLPANTGDMSLIPGLGRFPGEGTGYPLQYSGLENFMDCIVHGITKMTERLSLSECNYSQIYISSPEYWSG